MIGLLALVPLIITFIAWIIFKKRLHWNELAGALLVTYLFMLLAYFGVRPSSTDVEYNGHLIVKAEYYEEWETYVKRTCTRTYTTGSGKNKRTHTETYDCSYCDRTSEKFYLIAEDGSKFSTDKRTYERLTKQWKSNQTFVDLNRKIKKSFTCGKDGDMYYITWDGDILTHESYTTTHYFDNPLLFNRSIFNGTKLDSIQLSKTHEYPTLINGKQNTIIGLENVNIPNKEIFNSHLNFFNAKNGHTNKMRYYTIFFKDEDLKIAKSQENKYIGGNQNEVIICVGHNGNKMTWVYPFGWCENKVNLVNLREDLMQNDSIYLDKFLTAYNTSKTTFKPRDFHDFDYITYVPSSKDLFIMLFVILVVNIFALIIFIRNDFNEDDDSII